MNHTKNLMAYAYRLKSQQIERLLILSQATERAGRHLGTNAQLNAYQEMRAYCDEIIDSLLQHDLDNIEQLIAE